MIGQQPRRARRYPGDRRRLLCRGQGPGNHQLGFIFGGPKKHLKRNEGQKTRDKRRETKDKETGEKRDSILPLSRLVDASQINHVKSKVQSHPKRIRQSPSGQ